MIHNTARLPLPALVSAGEAGDLRSGKQLIGADGSIVTGTMPEVAGKTITPGTTAQTAVAAGRYVTGDVVVAGDANLMAENIAEGVSIFGVTGTHSGQEIVTCTAVNQTSSYTMTIYYTNGDGYFSKLVYGGTLNLKVSVNKYSFCLVESSTSVSVSGSAEVVNVNAVNGKVLFVAGDFSLIIR